MAAVCFRTWGCCKVSPKPAFLATARKSLNTVSRFSWIDFCELKNEVTSIRFTLGEPGLQRCLFIKEGVALHLEQRLRGWQRSLQPGNMDVFVAEVDI